MSFNGEVFDSFKKIHDLYSQEPDKHRSEFNRQGEKALSVIRRYESHLCKQTESGGFGKFSSALAGKFWDEIRETFPLIDEVGLL